MSGFRSAESAKLMLKLYRYMRLPGETIEDLPKKENVWRVMNKWGLTAVRTLSLRTNLALSDELLSRRRTASWNELQSTLSTLDGASSAARRALRSSLIHLRRAESLQSGRFFLAGDSCALLSD